MSNKDGFPRYEVRKGRWGMYFHDTVEGTDLTLQEVADLLNEADDMRSESGG